MTCFLLITHWIYNPIDRLGPWFAMSIFDDFRFLLKKRLQKRLLSCLMISNSILKRGFRLLPGNSGIKQKWQAITSRQWPSPRDHLCFCFLWFYLFSHLKHFCIITFLFLLSSIRESSFSHLLFHSYLLLPIKSIMLLQFWPITQQRGLQSSYHSTQERRPAGLRESC